MYGAEVKRITSIKTPDTFVGRVVGGRKLNNASLALASAAYSFSKSGGYGEKFVDMVQTLGFGRTSLFAAAKILTENNFISRNERGGFEIVDLASVGEGYDQKDFELRDTRFLFVENGRTVERTMTATEFNVLSRIRRHTFNEKTKCFKGSYASMVRTMAYSEPTIRKAISSLQSAGLIYITGKKRIAHYQQLTITVSEKVIRKAKKAEKAAAKAAEKATSAQSARSFVSPGVQAANDRAERERYYSSLKEIVRKRAEKAQAKAETDPRFVQIRRELATIEIEIAQAELKNPEKVGEILARKTALMKERSKILLKLRIPEEELTEKPFCIRCGDTGFLPDGRACDCFGLRSIT